MSSRGKHEPESADPPPLHRIIEAILFIGGAPLEAARACEAVKGLSPEQFVQQIAHLNLEYHRQGRPYRIQMRDQGYELAIRPGFQAIRERFQGAQKEARLSPPALDTLALVAYRQPVTRREIDGVRGADSLAQLRLLVRLGLVSVQRGDGSQPDMTYSTTGRFLKLFGLKNLDDLPRSEDLQKI